MRAKPSVTGARDFIRNTLHIDTLILPTIILKIVSFHDFPLRAAWAGHWTHRWNYHYLLCLTEQSFQGNVPLIIQNEKTPKFMSWMEICHQWKNNRLGSQILPMLALYISAILVFVECVMKCEEVVTRICGHQFKIGFCSKILFRKTIVKLSFYWCRPFYIPSILLFHHGGFF